jgi:integrase/recombinase XerC
MVESAVNGFFSYLNLQKRFSPLTAKSYETDLRQFSDFMRAELGTYQLGEISHHHIRSFMASLMEKGVSAVSVNRKISAIKSFFRYLLRSGTISTNPAQKIQGPKKPSRLPVFVEEDQLGTIFSGLTFGMEFEDQRDKLIVDVLYQTGLRRAELIGLQTGDVDLGNNQLKVLGKRNKERIIPFDVDLGRSISDYLRLKQNEGLSGKTLFVNKNDQPLTAPNLSRIVKRILGMVTTNKKTIF